MFGRKKRKDKKRKDKKRIAVQVEPTLEAIADGCYTDHVYQCIACKSVMYIAPKSTIKCEVCDERDLMRFDVIFQWKYGKWNDKIQYKDDHEPWVI